ncbi:MAG: aminotransferase class V-fold PLP-dependent enzyme, partial [Candidatus Hydrogenedentota bacterium]
MIDFHKPTFVGTEYQYIQQLDKDRNFFGDGQFSNAARKLLLKEYGAQECLLTFSGTTALETMFRLLPKSEKKEVIVPSYGFVSCANAVLNAGFTPVLADVSPETLSLTVETIDQVASKNTIAVLFIHYGGIVQAVSQIREYCKDKGIYFFEDAALSLFAKQNKKLAGTSGDMSILSFNTKKCLHCGQGGALLIFDSQFIEKAHIYKNRGTNRLEFEKGKVPFYEWIFPGSYITLSEINAAFLWAQLEKKESIVTKHRELFYIYYQELNLTAKQHNIVLPFIQKNAEPNGSEFFIRLNSYD